MKAKVPRSSRRRWPINSRLDWYVLSRISAPSCMAFVVMGFLAVSNELRERSGHLAAEILRPSDVLRLGLYFLPSVISYVVPIAFFFGTLLGLGRLAQEGEITAIKAAGASLKRLALPVIVLGGVLAVGCFVVQDRLQPWAVGRAYRLMQEELPARATINTLRPGVVHQYENWRVYFRSKDKTGNVLFDVDVVRPDEDGRPEVFHAERAWLELRDGARVLIMEDGDSVIGDKIRAVFDHSSLTIPSREVTASANRFRLDLTLTGLLASEKQRTAEYEASRSYPVGRLLLKERHEIANRLSLPFAALAVSFVGAPLGVRASRGRGGARLQQFSSGLGVLVLYYLLRTVLESGTLQDLDVSILRVWIPNVVMMAIGLVLLWRVDRI